MPEIETVSKVAEALRPSGPVPVSVTAVAWLGVTATPISKVAPTDAPTSALTAYPTLMKCPFDSPSG